MNQLLIGISWGLIIVLALWTLVNAFRHWSVFVNFMMGGFILWIVIEIVNIFMKPQLTFQEWIIGAGTMCFGGAVALFDLSCFFLNQSEKWERSQIEKEYRKPVRNYVPVMEVIQGEVVDEYPPLNARNPQTKRLLNAPMPYSWAKFRSRVGMPVCDSVKLAKGCPVSKKNHAHYVVAGHEFCEEI